MQRYGNLIAQPSVTVIGRWLNSNLGFNLAFMGHNYAHWVMTQRHFPIPNAAGALTGEPQGSKLCGQQQHAAQVQNCSTFRALINDVACHVSLRGSWLRRYQRLPKRSVALVLLGALRESQTIALLLLGSLHWSKTANKLGIRKELGQQAVQRDNEEAGTIFIHLFESTSVWIPPTGSLLSSSRQSTVRQGHEVNVILE